MKKLLVIILAITLTIVLAACGGDGGVAPPAETQPGAGVGTGTDANDGNNGDASTNEEAGGVDVVGERYGGVLRFASGWVISNSGYLPELTGNAALPFITLAHESLLTFDGEGNFIPLLATSWEYDPSEPSITWNLREGVYFTDGTPFNAEAVRVNILEYQDFGRSEVANVADFDIIDNYTIKMILHTWDSSMLESIGFFVYYTSPQALQDTDMLRDTSVGTGPFRVTEFTHGVRTVFERNENWWGGRAYLDGIEIHTVSEPTTRQFAFEAGEFDMIIMGNLIAAQQLYDTGLYTMQRNTSGAGLVGVGIIPNSAAPNSPFADPRVRQALSYAIDTELISQTFGGGHLQTTNQWAAPGSLTFNPNVRGYPFNPERARELLAEAGFPDGFDTVLQAHPGQQDTSVAIAHMLTEVGIRAAINQIEEAQQSEMMQAGWDGLMWHFHAVSPNLGLYMGRHLDGAFYVAGLLIPDEVMELLYEIRTAPTVDERVRLEHDMQILVYDELALFGQPLFIQWEPAFLQPHVMDSLYAVNNFWTWGNPGDIWLNN